MVQVEEKGQFMVLINPALINMGTTGYGLAGRRIRDEIISAFHTTYYLRTLPWGAVTRCVIARDSGMLGVHIRRAMVCHCPVVCVFGGGYGAGLCQYPRRKFKASPHRNKRNTSSVSTKTLNTRPYFILSPYTHRLFTTTH